jgi:hypothetical protein
MLNTDTAISAALRRPADVLRDCAVRAFTIFLSAAAIAWSALTIPNFWTDASIERIGTHVIWGEPYKPEILTRLLPALTSMQQAAQCRPAGLRAAAAIRLRLVEEAIATGDRAAIDTSLDSLSSMVRTALSCSPADAFLWLVLYWVDTARNGFDARYVGYLTASYDFGPNESWIALKRNKLGFAVFSRLPADLQQKVLREFVALLSSRFYAQAVDIFTASAWPVRDRVLAEVAKLDERHRQQFARILYSKGFDVAVPGVAPRDSRPWR